MIQSQFVFRSLPYLPDRVTEASSQGIAALSVSWTNRLPPYFRLAAGSGFRLGVQLARFSVLLASVGRTAVGSPENRVKFPPRSASATSGFSETALRRSHALAGPPDTPGQARVERHHSCARQLGRVAGNARARRATRPALLYTSHACSSAFLDGTSNARQQIESCARGLRRLTDAGAYAVDRDCCHRPIIGGPELSAQGHPTLPFGAVAVKRQGGAP